MVTLLVMMLCFCLRNYGCSKVMAMSPPTEEDLELERELQSLNKPPVKTIQVLFLIIYPLTLAFDWNFLKAIFTLPL